MYVKGVGMTKFGYEQKPWWQFAYEASIMALEDANMKISDIDAIVFSGMSSASGGEHQTHKTSVLSDLFRTNVPIIEVPSVCSGGGVAFWVANHLKGYRNILVVGAEHLVDNKSEETVELILSATEKYLEQREGLLFPVQNALVLQQYMQKYPEASMDDLALIAHKNHTNAVLNPKAYFYKRPVTLEQIKNSPVIASPFRAYDCSLSVNGGAAVIISEEESDIEIIGSGYATDYITTFSRAETTNFRATRMAADIAYKEAGVGPKDIQLAELHDAFTSVELFSYEDLGFAEYGKGGELIRSGRLGLDGDLPISTSGGLKAKGHPISATGLAQVNEIVDQLRGRCGERQVKNNPKIALTQNIGGAGGSVAVHIFKKK